MASLNVKVGVRQIAEKPDMLFPRQGSLESFTESLQRFRAMNGRTSVGQYVNVCFEYIRTQHPDLYDSSDPRYAACGKFGRQNRRVGAAKEDLLSIIDEIFCVKM